MRLFVALVLLVGTVTGSGCYATKVRSGQPRSADRVHQDRQWFTVGGLVPLSHETGGSCGDAGLSYAESRLSFMDILLNIGIAVGSASIGAGICDDSGDSAAYAACVSGASTLGTFLLGSRTVRYQCHDGDDATP